MLDEDVAPFVRGLDLPGIFDVHVHFMPKRVLDKVWAYFDARGIDSGAPWPIVYRGSDNERLAHLRAMGVLHFSALSYAHRPGMAQFLNAWARDFAGENADVLLSGTFYPEQGVTAYVRALLDEGVEVFKIHVQVGDFAPTDPLLDEAWGLIADAGTPVVLHAGSGPMPGTHTGPRSVAELLARHPRLSLVIAHMGLPEAADFLSLAETYDEVRLDTTMVFTDYFEAINPYPKDLLPRVRDIGSKILFGSDFPNIPYVYAHQLEGLLRLELGDDWIRDVIWNNAARLFLEGVTP
ncbi:amidohydrolase family protein [soil metagenome]